MLRLMYSMFPTRKWHRFAYTIGLVGETVRYTADWFERGRVSDHGADCRETGETAWREFSKGEVAESKYLSREFITYDTDEAPRAVADLSHVSSHYTPEVTKAETLESFSASLRRGDSLSPDRLSPQHSENVILRYEGRLHSFATTSCDPRSVSGECRDKREYTQPEHCTECTPVYRAVLPFITTLTSGTIFRVYIALPFGWSRSADSLGYWFVWIRLGFGHVRRGA